MNGVADIAKVGDRGHVRDSALSHIIQNYADPLTRFAMQDYPEDGGKGMSQVFHGNKMLTEAPSPPVVQVDGTIYYSDEILQEASGGYFIPEQFFLATRTATGNSVTENANAKETFALGQSTVRTEVCLV